MLQGTPESAARAKALRQEMSPAEIRLWLALRKRPAGLKFRKQHPSGPYVADFFCHAARLVVEVDGQAHDFGDRPQRDARRDQWFRPRGMEVLRLPARDVLRDCDAAVQGIVAVAEPRIRDEEG
ncbi:endonuclease domain-containing protein [Sphingomonas sp.]|uniref:endonuclease domain-containing protein n=1 Tax=Sphingomonas sp. TaxID=28214 RepID=UPI0035C84A5F